ncbi:MAG: DUF4112 domain-containing protein [Planctomycetota bacterium]
MATQSANRKLGLGNFSRGLPISRRLDNSAASLRLATLLDDAFRIPGTNIRFGWDSILGLFPGIGDAATTILALVPVATAWKLGVSRWIIAKMLFNIGVDAVIGAVPIAGDLFDLFFKANRRNAKLMQKALASRS